MLPLLGSENPSAVYIIIGHIYLSKLAGQHIVKLRLRRITGAADDIAISEYEGSAAHPLSGETTCGTPQSTEG